MQEKQNRANFPVCGSWNAQPPNKAVKSAISSQAGHNIISRKPDYNCNSDKRSASCLARRRCR